MIGHGGGINGFLSETRYYPEQDARVVVLANTTGPFAPSEVADAIGDRLFGTPEPDHGDYPGDPSSLVGEFRGPIRGQNGATIRVDLDDDGQLIVRGLGPVQPLTFLEGSTFASGGNRYTFDLEDGLPTRLRVDQIYGLYVLEAGALGPAEEVEVDPEVMARHVGRYDVAEMGAVAEVTLDEGALWIEIPGQPRLRLVPDGDDAYHIVEAPATFTFEVEDGRTVAMVIEQGATVIRAPRIEGEAP